MNGLNLPCATGTFRGAYRRSQQMPRSREHGGGKEVPWRPLCIKEEESVENRGKEKIAGIPKAALKGVATVSFEKRR